MTRKLPCVCYLVRPREEWDKKCVALIESCTCVHDDQCNSSLYVTDCHCVDLVECDSCRKLHGK
jgi:hypothetical protein